MSCSLIAPDDTTFSYLEGRTHAPRGADWEAALDYWRSLPTDADATFDKEVTIDAGPSTGDYPRGYAVSISNDGATWSQVATGTGTTQLITVTFPTQMAQYIQVTQTTSGATGNWWSIAEFNVYAPTPPAGTPIALSRASWVPSDRAV